MSDLIKSLENFDLEVLGYITEETKIFINLLNSIQ